MDLMSIVCLVAVMTTVWALDSDNFIVINSSSLRNIYGTVSNVNRNLPEVSIFLEDHIMRMSRDENNSQGAKSVNFSRDDIVNESEKSKCESKFGRREYKGRWVTDPPPLLLSFPGSGNTWTRLLIEVSTGIYTGDIYTDHSLKSVFAGEKSCGKRVSVVKAHPQDLNVSVSGEVYHTLPGNKCQRIGTTFFDKTVIIHRNPFKAIWSEFQRGGSRDRHAKGIPKDQFDWSIWKNFATKNILQFKQAWDEKYHHIFSTFSPGHFLVASYERLISDNVEEKKDELRKIVQFLGFPLDEKRIECAFLISFNSKVMRRKSNDDVSFEQAFSDEEASCKLWQIIQSMSLSTHKMMQYYHLDVSPPTQCGDREQTSRSLL